MKTSLYIWLTLALGLLLTACDDAVPYGDSAADVPDGAPVEIVTGAQFPEMSFGPRSRAMNDEPTPDDLLNSLKVNLFVFDQAGVMLQFIGPEDISIVSIDEVNKRVQFKVSNIYSSPRPRRLHFVLLSDDLRSVSGSEYIASMASETTTMPALVVDGGTDAYWGVMDVKEITENMRVDIKLIRNFVKLSVKSTASNFKLLGYTVVNRPNRGTIAPYIYRDHLFASFLNPDNTLLDYDEIIAQGYYGVNPSGGDSDMTYTTEADVARSLAESEARLASGTDTPYYIYERTQSSIANAGSGVLVTYIIVKGRLNGKDYYYKIDIGRDKDGKFGFYDLLRNFQYTVEIREVGGEGAPTLLDAMNGAVHNNLSTSVVTRDLFSIGYEGEMIEVGATSVIFTEKTADYALRFRYTTPTGMTFDPSKLKLYNVTDEGTEFDVSGVSTGGYKSVALDGEVIESASISRNSDGWYELHVSTKDIPTDARRLEQNVRIYYNGGSVGLGRTVTFMLRRPWSFGTPVFNSPTADAESGMTLRFTLPSGLSQAQFPLVITVESDKQNIYARNGSELTVATARSGFAGATTDQIILYERNVEWAEYSSAPGGVCWLEMPLMMNTTSAVDRNYSTAGIDAKGLQGRTNNNNTRNFCLRIANKGRKYIQPIYVNVTRP